jgi:peptidoglycan/LPS O-acetylase OafA/YrhL
MSPRHQAFTAHQTNRADIALPSSLHGRNNFDFVRLAMAVLVIFSHSFPLATGRQLGELPDDASLGRLALAVFFTVSGYLIAMSWDRSSGVTDFLCRRVLRIYPGFLVAFFISSYLIAPFVTAHAADLFRPRKLAASVVYAAALHDPKQVEAFASNPYPRILNGSLWTIHYEFGCYLLIALLGALGLLRRRPVVGLLLMTWSADVLIHRGLLQIGLVEQSLQTHKPVGVLIGELAWWPRFLSWFLAGSCFYCWRDFVRYIPGLTLTAMAGLAATLIGGHGWIFVWPFAVPYVTFWFAFHPRLNLHRTVEVLGGDYSYGTYLYAFVIQQLIVMRVPGIQPLMLFLLAAPLSVLAGLASWFCVERHFMRLKGRSRRELAHSPEDIQPELSGILPRRA